MNRIDRLFGILLLLQRKSLIRAEDIAGRYEITVRTIYRDIAALHELGVPIVSIPGEGYRLMDGFYLPPLVFTPDEASAIFLAGQLLVHQADGHLPDSTNSALEKIIQILPKRTVNHINQLTDIIHFSMPTKKFNLDDRQLVHLQNSIIEKRVIHMAYHSLKDDSLTERDVEPLQLTYANHNWYLTAYCRLRQDVREFRLDRIEHLMSTVHTFTPRQIEVPAQAWVPVQIKMKQEQARWIRERQHYGYVSEEHTNDKVIMTYHIHEFSEIKAWILAWGASVQVISPQAFVDEIREEIKLLLTLLT